MRFSRGVASLQPQAPPAADGGAGETASEARRLLPAFSALARGDSLPRSLSRLDLLQQARRHPLSLISRACCYSALALLQSGKFAHALVTTSRKW